LHPSSHSWPSEMSEADFKSSNTCVSVAALLRVVKGRCLHSFDEMVVPVGT
jgi:hypothetical protein